MTAPSLNRSSWVHQDPHVRGSYPSAIDTSRKVVSYGKMAKDVKNNVNNKKAPSDKHLGPLVYHLGKGKS